MVWFIVRRLLSCIVVLFCVASLTFLLARMMKGGPFDRERELPEHLKGHLEEKYKLNGTLWQQYQAFIADLVRGDLRASTKYRDWRVDELLLQKMPTSLALGACAFVIAAAGGVLAGAWAAMRKDSWEDVFAMFAALTAISVPTFVLGPLLIAIFSLWLGWLPVGGWGLFSQLALPAICLAAPYAAYVARLMRNSLIEVLQSDFMRTARAKGLGEWQALARHAMKVAILPVIGFLGPLAANLLTGSMVVESIFNIPGGGVIFVNAIQNRDVMLLVGAVIIYSFLLVFFNFVVDLAYSLLDKRIRLHG
ncbi:MAG: ABC transporter permease [Verrucomicrobiaceae bacterium]|nr:ABC transporter permease [Verrucomicrobiaceae bacterium]